MATVDDKKPLLDQRQQRHHLQLYICQAEALDLPRGPSHWGKQALRSRFARRKQANNVAYRRHTPAIDRIKLQFRPVVKRRAHAMLRHGYNIYAANIGDKMHRRDCN